MIVRSIKNKRICGNTLSALKEQYKRKLTSYSVILLFLLIVTIWVYIATDGFPCFFYVFLLSVLDSILLLSILSKLSGWLKYKDMSEFEFEKLQKKAKNENEDIERAGKAMRYYNAGHKIGQFWGGL